MWTCRSIHTAFKYVVVFCNLKGHSGAHHKSDQQQVISNLCALCWPQCHGLVWTAGMTCTMYPGNTDHSAPSLLMDGWMANQTQPVENNMDGWMANQTQPAKNNMDGWTANWTQPAENNMDRWMANQTQPAKKLWKEFIFQSQLANMLDCRSSGPSSTSGPGHCSVTNMILLDTTGWRTI